MRVDFRVIAMTIVFVLATLGMVPSVMAQAGRTYRYSDSYMRQLLERIETRSDQFSNRLPDALDRSRVNGTDREDEVNRTVTEFEAATDQLRERFNDGQSTGVDAQAVLQHAAEIDRFMRAERLDYRTEQSWVRVRSQLNRLAQAYYFGRNWASASYPWPDTQPIASNYDSMLTGTFSLNKSLSDNPATVANNATRYVDSQTRNRIYNNVINRLTPPETLAIERQGNSVTLASTRSPRVTFDADNRERVETYPNGRTSRVRASFTGARLRVVSNGDRDNDFTATFAPLNNGQRLLVTRQIYAESINQPILVQSYYDRTSQTARFDEYGTTPSETSENFVIPNGTEVMAVLNQDLSTKTATSGTPFTMTVRSPSAYYGATLEGYLADIDRGGKVTGRSEMTFNFERIRLVNGRTYNFAGIIEKVRPLDNDEARVDNEGAVRESESRTSTTVKRSAIGSAVGALIGAIAGGGKGAAIGAVVGAGAGAGSVYVQGRDDLELKSGSEFTIRASAPAQTGMR